MYDDFFNSLFNDFNEIASNWNRNGFKEKDGYQIIPQKNGCGIVIAFNTIGVAESDLKVLHKTTDNRIYLKVSGNTKIPEMNNVIYTANYELKFIFNKKVEDVQYKVKDGFTFVYIKTKEPIRLEDEAKTAKNIADGDDFDW